MIKKNSFLALWSVTFIFMVLLTGCKDAPAAAVKEQPATNPVSAAPPAAAVEPVDTAAPQSPSASAQPTPQPAAVNPNDKVSLASADPGAAAPDTDADESRTTAVKPKIDIQAPYNQSKPTLLGLTLKTSADGVIAKYGKPKSQFTMDDESDPISVYDYSDFLVGFNKNNQLQFIDVRSGEINPGLNGLKLGQTTGDVYKALGKPDSNTSFVFTYKSPDAVLKLDIDPKTDKVNSIKLFAAE